MKQARLIFVWALALLLLACNAPERGGQCRILGTINPHWNGRNIYLVPLMGPTDAAHVDSAVIKNGRFEFATDTVGMAVIRVGYRYRMGLQELLVVTEPGEVRVHIDSISSGGGTPQNDSLSKWKQAVALRDSELRECLRLSAQALQRGDTVEAVRLRTGIEGIHGRFKTFTLQMAAGLHTGPLSDFLFSLYPGGKPMPGGGDVTHKQQDTL